MTANLPPSIVFDPYKFWQATQEMSRDDLDRLMERVVKLAEEGDLEGLRRFDFIRIEE